LYKKGYKINATHAIRKAELPLSFGLLTAMFVVVLITGLVALYKVRRFKRNVRVSKKIFIFSFSFFTTIIMGREKM
jgi:hypothetical protein